MTASAAWRIRWYSLSVKVWAGATVIESPVCTPMGSKFSIEQMMTTLSFRSRIILELELLPADDRLLHQHLLERALLEPPLDRGLELLGAVGDGAAGAAQGERGPDDEGELHAPLPHAGERVLRAPGVEALG